MQQTREMIAARVCVVLQEHFSLPTDRLILETEDFFDDLGGDSLDMAEVVMKCEEEFDINIPDLEAQPRKIGEIIDVAVNCLEAPTPAAGTAK